MTRTLVSTAGLVPALQLAGAAGLHDLLEQRLSVDWPNPVGGLRALSALGTYLRAFTRGHV